ncbi:hypothetical protein Oscil6304_0851 [Oscillatoria acuminata PCC 6304]|uniref:Uncharacterized protein n=1 Tax=Oscillatoria acuminata PCC 6304 TaxID=56110 RepID=K9TEZ2_9CYAN|nr:hypothetical protein Oscil6304_0851 [Oscillatoria acuminata PCC 6304]
MVWGELKIIKENLLIRLRNPNNGIKDLCDRPSLKTQIGGITPNPGPDYQ